MDNKAVPSLLPVYRRYDLAFARGEGSWLYTTDGRRLLDFASGIAVTGLGHAHPHLMATLAEQGGKLWHVSNLFRIPELERLADRLVAHTFADTVFVCNSGAEAIEACIKMVRRYHWAHRGPRCPMRHPGLPSRPDRRGCCRSRHRDRLHRRDRPGSRHLHRRDRPHHRGRRG